MLSNFSALIGNSVIPRLGVVDIEATSVGYRISGHADNEEDKMEILRNVGPIRKGQVEQAKFVTRDGVLVNESFLVMESKFEEEQLPDHRRFMFTILLNHP